MSAVHIPSLPRFSGQPQDLARFFDEFEVYAAAAGYLDDVDKIACVTRYAVDMKTQRLWDRLPQSMDRDWSAFQAAVEKLSPEPADDPCYSVSSLETLCRNRSQSSPTARLKEDFDLFHAEFIAIASYLQDRNLIFEQELKKLYISAFDTPTQQKIHAAIFKLKPFHYPGRLYPADYIHELTTSAFETNSSIHADTPTSSSPQPPTPSSPPLDATAIQDMINKMQQETIATLTQFITDTFQQVLVTFLRAQNTPSPASTPFLSPSRHAAAPRSTPPPRTYRPSRCGFCHEPDHTSRHHCPSFQAMHRLGWVYVNDRQRYTLPNGQEITRAIPGKSFKEQIENWLRYHRLPLTRSHTMFPPPSTSSPPTLSITSTTTLPQKLLLPAPPSTPTSSIMTPSPTPSVSSLPIISTPKSSPKMSPLAQSSSPTILAETPSPSSPKLSPEDCCPSSPACTSSSKLPTPTSSPPFSTSISTSSSLKLPTLASSPPSSTSTSSSSELSPSAAPLTFAIDPTSNVSRSPLPAPSTPADTSTVVSELDNDPAVAALQLQTQNMSSRNPPIPHSPSPPQSPSLSVRFAQLKDAIQMGKVKDLRC
ncbi:hypothetical protein ONZ45_g19377 [Pleurotus djamor]|nr:hypothetical protein ONZ45_g19377 [Pleurotus djamor]